MSDTFWEGEAPAEPRVLEDFRLGGSLALPQAVLIAHVFRGVAPRVVTRRLHRAAYRKQKYVVAAASPRGGNDALCNHPSGVQNQPVSLPSVSCLDFDMQWQN